MKNNILKENEKIEDLGINNLKLIQNKDYFIYGTDSVLLANFVSSNSSKNNIIDLCSGSGVVPILLSAKVKYNKMISVELQKEMYDILFKNINLNKLDNDILTINEDIKNVDKIRTFLTNNNLNGRVNIITVNPPYKPKGEGVINENNVKYIARHEDKCSLEDIFNTSSKLLESKGKLYIVHKPERIVDLLSLSRKYNLEAKKIRYIYPKINLKPSIVLIEYVKDGGNECIIEKCIIQYDDKGNYTKEFLEICGGKYE